MKNTPIQKASLKIRNARNKTDGLDTIGQVVESLVQAFTTEGDSMGPYILARAAEEAAKYQNKLDAERDVIMARIKLDQALRAEQKA